MTAFGPVYDLPPNAGQVLMTPHILGGGIGGVNIVRGDIRSEVFTTTVEGWRIRSDGTVEFNDGVFRGDLAAAGGTFSGDLDAAGGTFTGNLSAAGGTFTGDLSAAGGTFTGDLSAAGGTYTGTLSAVDGTFTGTLSGVDGTFTGDLIGGELHIPDTGTGFHVDGSGDVWAGETDANKATAPFSIDAATGDVLMNDAELTGDLALTGTLTMDGGVFLTNDTGQRIEIDTSVVQAINFYTGDGNEETPASIFTQTNSVRGNLRLRSPFFEPGDTNYAFLDLYSGANGGSDQPQVYLGTGALQVALVDGTGIEITGTTEFSASIDVTTNVLAATLQTDTVSGQPLVYLQRFAGTLDGSGNATFAHGQTNGHLKCVLESFFFEGGSGEAIVPALPTTIDGTNVYITCGGPAAGQGYRGMVVWATDTSGW